MVKNIYKVTETEEKYSINNSVHVAHVILASKVISLSRLLRATISFIC